jgi:hypothetical protein
MMYFTEDQARTMVSGRGYDFYIKLDYDEARSNNGLTRSADFMLSVAIECILAGLPEKATPLLETANRWIQDALHLEERPQDYFPDYTEEHRADIASMLHWLSLGEDEPELLSIIIDHIGRYLAGQRRLGKVDLELTLPSLLNARAYQATLDWLSKVKPWTPPSPSGKSVRGLDACYFIASHCLGSGEPPQSVLAQIRPYLQRTMNTWLLDGHFMLAARWMKIVFWNDINPAPEPAAVVRQCFHFIPQP